MSEPAVSRAPSISSWRRRLLIGGAVSLVLGLLALYLAFRTPPPALLARQRTFSSLRNLERIGVALLEYAERHGEGHRFPDELEQLYQLGLLEDRQLLVCPALAARGVAAPHYQYQAGVSLLDPSSPGQERLLVYQPQAAHTYRDRHYAFGLCSDLRVTRALYPLAEEAHRQRALRADLADATLSDGGASALAAALSAPSLKQRRVAASLLWRQPALRSAAIRRGLLAGTESADAELALAAALALRARDVAPTRQTALALRILSRRAQGDSWIIGEARRRLLLAELSRGRPAGAPAPPFAYDPAPTQQRALTRWIETLEN